MTPAYQPGNDGIGTAIVLAAPGSWEEKLRCPAAGQTGTNLDGILRFLNQADPASFPSVSRRDYRIANAVETIHYRAKTGRTMPTQTEILEPANLVRLAAQLDGFQTIVALSDAAELAVRGSGRAPTFHFRHPSTRSLNGLYRGLGGERLWRVQRRYKLFAEDLLASRG